MFCIKCGQELRHEAKFCPACGCSTNDEASPLQPSAQRSSVLTWILSIALILIGILPLFLSQNMVGYGLATSELLHLGYSVDSIVALNCLRKFALLGADFFSFCCGGFSVLTGALLLKQRGNAKRMLSVSLIFQSLSLLRTGIAVLLIFAAPEWVISLFSWDAAVSYAGSELLHKEAWISAAIFSGIWIDILFCVLSIGLCIPALLTIKKQSAAPKYGTLGIALMLPILALLQGLGQVFTNALYSTYGDYALVASSSANAIFTQYAGVVCTLLIYGFILLSVLCVKVRRWVLALPTSAVVLLLGLMAILLAKPLLFRFSVPEASFSMALSQYRGMVCNAVLMLIALFFWFDGVAKQHLPLWLQILIPLVLPLVRLFWEPITMYVFQWNTGFSFGCLRCAWITLIISLLVKKKSAFR